MNTVQMVGDVVDAELLVEITGDVFAAMFGEEHERPYPTPSSDVAHTVRSAVRISGGWDGAVVFSCGLALVRFAVAELFAVAEDEVTVAEVTDLAGEVVNVVGGNVKSLLPGPSALSLPRTVLESTGAPEEVAVSVDMEWCGHPLRVQVAPWGDPAP